MILYIPKQRTKIYLIIVCALITLNVIFISSKNYDANHYNGEGIRNASEMQYQSCLNTLSFHEQVEFIGTTKISYIFNLPEETLFFIYFGYFLISAGLILSTKFKPNDSDYEN